MHEYYPKVKDRLVYFSGPYTFEWTNLNSIFK